MKKETLECDISNRDHHVTPIKTVTSVPVVFDHDQEDGKSKVKPYIEYLSLEMCDSCFDEMMTKRHMVYGYGAMGYNTYTL